MRIYWKDSGVADGLKEHPVQRTSGPRRKVLAIRILSLSACLLHSQIFFHEAGNKVAASAELLLFSCPEQKFVFLGPTRKILERSVDWLSMSDIPIS